MRRNDAGATPPAATAAARLETDADTARKLFGALSEHFPAEEVAVGVFEDAAGRWSLTLHFRDHPDEAAVRQTIAAEAGSAAARTLTFETLAAQDWVRRSAEAFSPVEAGRFVVHGAHARSRIGANRIGIEIEAGLAFGTGHHGSTRGCLLALDGIAKTAGRKRPAIPPTFTAVPRRPLAGLRRSERARAQQRGAPWAFVTRRRSPIGVLDIGTGTGVLAIAAAKALRRPVLASDIDRRAVAVARDNVRLNRVARAVELIHAGGVAPRRFRQRGPFALLLANILLEPLQQLSTPLLRLAAPNAHVVLAGLLLGQAAGALASYRARGFVLERRIRIEGWATLVLVRPGRRQTDRMRRPCA
jgi:ribosomal protein L11 methyltransferase